MWALRASHRLCKPVEGGTQRSGVTLAGVSHCPRSAPAFVPAPVARSQSASRYPAMRVRNAKNFKAKQPPELSSRSHIYMRPINRNSRLKYRSTTAPSQAVDERDAAPRRLHEVCRHETKGDVHPGGGAATMGADVVSGGRASLTAEAALLLSSTETRDDVHAAAASLFFIILSR